jgi:hypothetical protein
MGESMFDPITEQMLGLIRGYWVSQIVGTLAELKIPDHLANGALRHDELANPSYSPQITEMSDGCSGKPQFDS